jgi:hypothetical protein
MQAQIAASLRHLKESAAHLSDAALAIGDADELASANIEHLLHAVLAEIRRLERLHSQS